jgi:Spy/CpxP family protein refolding chaperone
MDKDKIDMTKVAELADKISKTRAEIVKAQFLHVAQVASILTKDQRTKLEQLRAERRQMKEERP